MKLKVGCGEWGFRNLPIERHFEICRDFGFKHMEIGIGGPFPGRLPARLSLKDVDSFIAMRGKYAIETPFCCLENDFTLPAVSAHEANLSECLEQMRLAARLGCAYVRLFAGFTPYQGMTEAIWKRMLSAFEEAELLASELGVSIAIETHGKIDMVDGSAIHTHTVTTHRDGIRRLLDELPARIGFNYDPGNIKATDKDDKRYALDLLDERINYCHLKDWICKGPGFAAAAPGDDDLDYAALLPKMAFRGVCLIEYEPTEDVVDGIRRSLEYLKRSFDVELE